MTYLVAQWHRIQHITRHWPTLWHLLIALAGSLISGLIMLDMAGLLQDFITLFNIQ